MVVLGSGSSRPLCRVHPAASDAASRQRLARISFPFFNIKGKARQIFDMEILFFIGRPFKNDTELDSVKKTPTNQPTNKQGVQSTRCRKVTIGNRSRWPRAPMMSISCRHYFHVLLLLLLLLLLLPLPLLLLLLHLHLLAAADIMEAFF